MRNYHSITKDTYEDKDVVENYIQTQSVNPKQKDKIIEFSKTIKGKKVLDLGCGPGHDSYIFAELGFDVTGLDYSNEMIRRAKTLRSISNMPCFVVGDMRKLNNHFNPNTYDAIWASASLIHLPSDGITPVLNSITNISKNGTKLFISLKDGNGFEVVQQEKYNKIIRREFMLWSKEKFLKIVKSQNWLLDRYNTNKGALFKGKSTIWHQFYFTIRK